ncbi:mitotic spindle checkpoint protein MAD1-like [Chenopodium quinoa]|uniref:Mitotic spindle checkpoint protein MAD1 n=1 Tax=Chenopodium quinoa TaxID=63459 RepID=A0A803MMG9_CHEQI|nr:mitotic spindle checkpoint protein MAD1-like [Chenopodium quinoa]
MILRTPPPRKRRAESNPPEEGSPAGRLVIYEDPPSPQPESSPLPSDHLLCTYQCRQMVKAELLDNYASMEKTIDENQSKLVTLNENLLTAEEEGKKYRDQFLYAEQELAAARGREQSLQDKLLKEIKESQERLTKQIQQCNELEVKLQKEESMRRSSESSAAAAEEKANRLERKLNQLSDSTERERKNLQDELKHLKGDSKLSMSRLRAELERVQCQSSNAVKESEQLKKKLEEVIKQLNKCLQEKNELETKISSFTCPEEGSESSQNDVLLKHLQEELRNYEYEVLEARKLKASHENIELVKEKLIEERRRRERAEAELTKLQEIQLSMNVLEDELASWKKILKEIPGVESSDDVPLKFVALQKEVIDGMAKLGEANTRLKQLEVALEGAELDKKNVESETALAKEKEESLKLEIKELKSKLLSVNEDGDQLRTAYNELKQQTNVEPGYEAVGRALTQGLESSLAQKDTYIKELELNLSEHKAANDRQRNEIRMLNEKLNSEARKIKSLERESDRLRSEIALLESKLGHGDFSSANTKVLRMVNALGVESEARQTIEALQCELQKANEKLQVVEELKKQSADAGQLVDSYISGKIVQLKEQISTLEKREERYKTVFADRISVFRRACCELFGYKIVMDDQHRSNGIPITRFTLQSIYAQSDDEKLEFEYESGNTNILINDYAKQRDISRQVEIFIRKLNSIPAFTANITVESFNKRTLS